MYIDRVINHAVKDKSMLTGLKRLTLTLFLSKFSEFGMHRFSYKCKIIDSGVVFTLISHIHYNN